MCQYFSKAESLLGSISPIYQDTFQDKIEKPNSTQKINSINDIKRLKICDQIREIGIEIYENLNLSVIQGSYVENHNFEDRIIQFETILRGLDIPGDIELYNCISDCFTKILLNSLKQYQYLAHDLQAKNNNPDKLFLLYDFGTEPLGNYQGDLSFDLTPHADLFLQNILISILDRDFSLNNNILKRLFEITHKLQNHTLKNGKVCKLLIDKCHLLIFKFIAKGNDEYFRTFSISHDFIDVDIDPSKIEMSYLTHFRNLIENAYPSKREDNYDYLKRYYQDKNGEPVTFEDFFIFVQFYRKVTENTKDIDSLISRFKDKFKFEADRKGFNKRSYDICLNYLFNNKISLLSKRTFKNIEDIDSILTEIQDIQNKTGIYNFFPYAKIAKCYINFLNQIIYTYNIDEHISDVQKAIHNLGGSINCFKRYLERSDIYSILPFRPNFSGCCCQVQIDAKVFDVFVASAYIIPTNYEKYIKELSELESEHQIFKTILVTQEFINKTKKENQELLEKNKKESQKAIEFAQNQSKAAMKFAQDQSEAAMKFAQDQSEVAMNAANDSQKNNIQILSVFAALVVFAMGNFQVYRMVNTFHEAIVFTFSLAFSLCLFAIVIWFIVSKKKGDKMTWTHIIACGLLMIGLAACIFEIFIGSHKNTPIIPQSKSITIPTDSININNVSIQNIVYPQNEKKQKEDTLSTKVVKGKSNFTQIKNNISTNHPNTRTK